MRARLRSLAPDALVVVDMGSRPGVILDAVPTLVIDHHDATGGVPPNAIVVNGFDREPVAPSSVLAYAVCQGMPGIEASAWLAALGAVGDWAPRLHPAASSNPYKPIHQEDPPMATEFAHSTDRTEGRTAKAIEKQTAKLPSDTFLWMAFGSMAISAAAQTMGNKDAALFVGQWAPTLLILGLYNKIVKEMGSDHTEHA